jgi:hypothetical protein
MKSAKAYKERVIIIVQRQMSNFSAILWRTSYIRWDDDDVHFVLYQHA